MESSCIKINNLPAVNNIEDIQRLVIRYIMQVNLTRQIQETAISFAKGNKRK